MLLIKRYPNRKLYNTQSKEYITLDRIADLIHTGEEIQVFDHATGEDLTSITLTQVLLEQLKRRVNFFPKTALTQLIRISASPLSQVQRVLEIPFQDKVRSALNAHGLATRSDIRELLVKMDELTSKLDEIHQSEQQETHQA